jgi:hypothetical protein
MSVIECYERPQEDAQNIYLSCIQLLDSSFIGVIRGFLWRLIGFTGWEKCGPGM